MSKLFQATRILVLSIAGASLACATKIDDQPSQYKGPLQPVGIYATDTGVIGLPDFAVWSAGPLGAGNNVVGGGGSPTDTNPNVPPSFNQLRVEFNQPLNPGTVANNLDLIGTRLRYNYCTPVNNSVQLIAMETTPRTIPSSICYDPGSGIGGNPKVVILPGAGTLATGGVTPSPLTCHDFTPTSGETFVKGTAYQIKIASTVKGQYGGAFQSPSGNGWDGNGTYTFTPDTFELLEVGYQNATTGFNYYQEKLKGFQSGVPATPGPQQVDCDFGSTSATQQPCRIPPDTTPIQIVANDSIDPATITPGAVTLTRQDGSLVDASIGQNITDAFGNVDPRIITVNTGSRWEPNTAYTLTINSGIKAADGTALAGTFPKVYNFTAGSGLTAGSTNSVTQVVSVSPDKGTTANSIGTTKVVLSYSYPADISKATFSVKDSSATPVVSGPATVLAGTAGQRVVIPISGLQTGTVYTVSAAGVTVGPNVPTAGASFGTFTSTFRTQEFNVAGIFDTTSAPNGGPLELDGTSLVPPETLVDGDFNAVFVNPVDTGTVTPNTSLVVNEKGTLLTTTQVASADKTTYTVTPADPAFKAKFNTTYQLVASTSIKDAGDVHALKAEGCLSGDCSQSMAFKTAPFVGTIKTKSTGSFSIIFQPAGPGGLGGVPPPGTLYAIDSTPLMPFLGSPANSSMFALYQETLTVNPATGEHVRTADFSKPVPVNCTINASNTKISCAPVTPLPPNTYYLASATFYKTAGSTGVPAVVAATQTVATGAGTPVTVNFDQTTGTFFGTLQKEIITPCP